MKYIKISLFSFFTILIYFLCISIASLLSFPKFINNKNIQSYINNKLSSKYDLNFTIDHIATNIHYSSLKLKFNSVSIVCKKSYYIKIKKLKINLIPFKIKNLWISDICINFYKKSQKNKKTSFDLKKPLLFLSFIEDLKIKNAFVKSNNLKINFDVDYEKSKKFINVKLKLKKNLIDFFVYLKNTPIIFFSCTDFKINEEKIHKALFIKKGLLKSIKGIGTFSKDFKNVYFSVNIFASYVNLTKQNRKIQIKNSKFCISYVKKGDNNYTFSSIITQRPKFKGLNFLVFQPDSIFFKGKINYFSYKDITKLCLFLNQKISATIFDIFRAGDVKDISLSYQGKKGDIKSILKDLKVTFLLKDSIIKVPKLKDILIQNLNGKFAYYKYKLSILKASGKALSSILDSIQGNISLLKPYEIKLKSKITCKLDNFIPIILKNMPRHISDTYYKNISTLKGNCKGSFYLYKRSKTIKLSIYIKKFQFNVLPVKFTSWIKLNGTDLRFNLKKDLYIDRFSIYYRNSQIKNVSLKINLSKDNFLNYFVSFKKGILSLTDFPISKFLPQSIHNLSGEVLINPSFLKGNLTVPKPVKINVNLDLKNVKLKYEDIPENIVIKSGKVAIDKSSVDIKTLHVFVLNSGFICMGNIKFAQKNVKYSFDIKGNLSESLAKLLYKRYKISHSFLINPCKLNFHFSNDNSKLNVQGNLVFNDEIILFLKVNKEKVLLKIKRKVYKDIINLAYMEMTKSINTYRIFFKGNLYNYVLSSIFSDNNFIMLESMKGDFITFINFENFSLNKFQGDLFIKNFNSSIFKNSIFLNKIKLESYKDSIFLNGLITINGVTDITIKNLRYNFKDKKIDGKILSNVIDYNDLALFFNKKPKKNKNINIFSSLNIDARVKKLKFKKYTFNKCNFKIKFDKNSFLIILNKLDFCSLPIKGEIDLKRKKLVIYLKGKNINFKDFLTCYAQKDFIIGQMDIDLNINTSFKNKDFIKNTNGDISIELKKGRIFKFNILMKILAVLNSLDIFFGNTDLIKKGMGYNRIIIKGNIKNSKLNIKEGILNGKSIEIFFHGKYDLSNRKMNFLVFVCPLKTIDRILKHIPLLNKITGGNILSIPLQVVGTYKRPIVIPVSPKAISSQILQLFKRTIKAPFTIFQPK